MNEEAHFRQKKQHEQQIFIELLLCVMHWGFCEE